MRNHWFKLPACCHRGRWSATWCVGPDQKLLASCVMSVHIINSFTSTQNLELNFYGLISMIKFIDLSLFILYIYLYIYICMYIT